ncbi:MAG: response regulator transcription factor [Bacteroidales bacterium]|nr:response regulator transcription factor [Bacteroidales bacterium]
MEYNKFRILLVDDEEDILEFLTYNLEKEGFIIYTAKNGVEAIDISLRVDPHLILLDVMMPEMDGIETCEEIRRIPHLKNVMIAFLTARGEDYSQIAGFEAGGDDYITKPIKPKLLVSKVKALLKRNQKTDKVMKASESQEEIADLTIDKERYIVILKGKELFLPKKEFELLNLLISKPEKVFTREEIFHRVWGDNIIVGDRTIDVHIRKLREKLGQDYIRTVKGVGYKFTH